MTQFIVLSVSPIFALARDMVEVGYICKYSLKTTVFINHPLSDDVSLVELDTFNRASHSDFRL